jgi:glucokinase
MERKSPQAPGRIALAVEIGGTKLQAALAGPDGVVLSRVRGQSPADEGAPGILEWFGRHVPAFLASEAASGRVPSAAGVGFGGPVETATGRVLQSFQVAGWEGVALRAWFGDLVRLPVTVQNDTNAAGWAEYRAGAGRGVRQFFYTNIGSGIGGALVLDGRLHDGQGLGAGELGHTWVPDWTAPRSGLAKKLEDLCSGWSIEKRLRASVPESGTPLDRLCGGYPSRITCALLGEAARQGDAAAIAELDNVANAFGLALANLAALAHPERIAVGGGVALMGDVLLDRIRASLERHLFAPYRGRCDVVASGLGEDAVLSGAALLALGD